jgi:hypothetical protein
MVGELLDRLLQDVQGGGIAGSTQGRRIRRFQLRGKILDYHFLFLQLPMQSRAFPVYLVC